MTKSTVSKPDNINTSVAQVQNMDEEDRRRYVEYLVRLPSFSGHPICTDLVSVGEDVHCESTAQEVHA